MSFEQFLSIVIVIGTILGILILGILKAVKMQKNDGTIDEEEQMELLEYFRNRILDLVKVALELQRRNEIGPEEVITYVVDRVYTEIQNSSALNEAEKALISKELIAKFIEFLGDEYSKIVEDFNKDEEEVIEPTTQPAYSYALDEVEADSLYHDTTPTVANETFAHIGNVPEPTYIEVATTEPVIEELVSEVITESVTETEPEVDPTPVEPETHETPVDVTEEAVAAEEENIAETMNDDVEPSEVEEESIV